MQRDLANRIQPLVAVPAQAIATDTETVGLILDVKFVNSGVVELFTGAVTAGDIAITKIEEGNDSGLSDAVEIPAARIWGALGTAVDAANTVEYVGFDAEKQYVRVSVTTANTADLVAGANIILGNAITKDYKKIPVNP